MWIRDFIQNNLSANKVRILFSSSTTAIARITHMLVMFASVPLALNYLGTERYGIWMAATSFIMILISFGDGGISNSLITAAAKANERAGLKGVRQVIGSAAAIIIPISFMICTIAIFVVDTVNWKWLFNLQSSIFAEETKKVVLIVVVGVAANFVVNIIMRVRYGLQQIPGTNFWEALSSIAIIPALYATIILKLGIIWVVSAVVLTPLLVKAIGSFYFLAQNTILIPKPRDINFTRSIDLARGGFVFFIITITHAIAVQSDQVLIANIVGPATVADYVVMHRLFTVPFIVANFLLVSLWPVFTSAYERNDLQWIRSTFRKTFWGIGIYGILSSFLLYIFVDDILALWIGDTIRPSFWLSLGMLLYSILVIFVGIFSTLFLSLDIRGPQIWISISMAVVNLPLSYILIHKIGAGGAIIATAFSYFFCMLVPYLVIFPRYLNRGATEN